MVYRLESVLEQETEFFENLKNEFEFEPEWIKFCELELKNRKKTFLNLIYFYKKQGL
jgi:hypothetical protein